MSQIELRGARTAVADAPAAAAALPRASRRPRLARAAAPALLRRVAREPGFLLSVLVIAIVVAWVVVPNVFTPIDPLATDAVNKFQAPSFAHPFGTDYIGRDIFSRVVHGSALSLQATVLALSLAFVASAIIGLLAGFIGGVVDSVLMRIVDVFLAVPGLLISLLLITALGFGMVNIAIAVAVGSVASFSRVMRAEVMRVSASPFVEAARAGGVRWPSILVSHVLPHARGPVLSLIALEFGAAILSIASLSFLGFGVALPEPEWGSLVAEGRSYLGTAWWMTLLPGAVVVAVVVSANRLSRGLAADRAERAAR